MNADTALSRHTDGDTNRKRRGKLVFSGRPLLPPANWQDHDYTPKAPQQLISKQIKINQKTKPF